VPALSRSEIAAYAVCALLVAVVGWRALRSDAVAGSGHQAASGSGPAPVTVRRAPAGPVLVHVTGAVRRPGVYRLRDGARVQDAVRRAGGTRGRADVQAVNLAAKVADGQQVVIPLRAAAGAAGGGAGAVAGGGTGAAPVGAAAGGGAGAAGGGAGGVAGTGATVPAVPLNLNTATAEQLDALDGVGPATAQKILEYRAQHGGFGSVDDLGEIPGIGPKRLEALRDKVQP
jgi:competence protein ComEA